MSDERPYIVVWYNYVNQLEQIRKYTACLPERIGADRHWKIMLHAHGKNGSCNTNCDILERPINE